MRVSNENRIRTAASLSFNGMKRKEIAEAMQVKYATVQRWERHEFWRDEIQRLQSHAKAEVKKELDAQPIEVVKEEIPPAKEVEEELTAVNDGAAIARQESAKATARQTLQDYRQLIERAGKQTLVQGVQVLDSLAKELAYMKPRIIRKEQYTMQEYERAAVTTFKVVAAIESATVLLNDVSGIDRILHFLDENDG